MWPTPWITMALNYGSCFCWARTGTYMDLKLTTVQQRGQNHQSRTRASNSNRAKSNHSTQVPSDWNILTLISCTCYTAHTPTFSSSGTHNGWELTGSCNCCWPIMSCHIYATHTCCGVDGDGTGDVGLSIVQADQHLDRSAVIRHNQKKRNRP